MCHIDVKPEYTGELKKCSCCGKKKKHLRLSQRVYRCAFCGNMIDRDLNAAINIRNEGMRILTLT